MDPFHGLPPELRQGILCFLDNRQDVKNISRASPIMFHQAVVSKIPILRNVLRNDLPGELLQDAVAVVTFPSHGVGEYDTERAEAMKREHLRKWALRQLPNPLRGTDPSVILALDSLYRRMGSYIHDYLSKATSFDIRRAYLRLPSWAHSSYSESSLDPLLEEPEPSRPSLVYEEYCRIWQSFLLYDILCRSCSPRPVSLKEMEGGPSLFAHEHIVWFQFREILCELLNINEDFYGWNNITRIRRLRPGERRRSKIPHVEDRLHCVHEYVITLYTSLFLRKFIATKADDSSFHHPHNGTDIPFSAEVALRAGLRAHPVLSNFYDNILPGFGFDLLDACVRSPRSTLVSMLSKLNDEIRSRPPQKKPGRPMVPLTQISTHTFALRIEFELRRADSKPGHWKTLANGTWLNPQSLWAVYRQRAVPFLLCFRRHHNKCRFPASQVWYGAPKSKDKEGTDFLFWDTLSYALECLQIELSNDDTNEVVNDSYDSKRKDFDSWKLMVYPSIREILTPFWKRTRTTT